MAPMFEDCAVGADTKCVRDGLGCTLLGFWWVTGQDGQGCFGSLKFAINTWFLGLYHSECYGQRIKWKLNIPKGGLTD